MLRGVGSTARRRRKPLLCALAFVGLIAAGIAATQWLTQSPRFAIERVESSERAWLSDEALHRHLEIDDAPNLFLYDTGEAATRLMSSPWVREATVRRSFPDGLEVDVVENEPAAVVVLEHLYLIDEDGTPFKRTSAAEIAELGLIVITGVAREHASAKPDEAAATLATALAVAHRWNDSPTRPRAAEVHVDAVRGYSIVTDSGAPTVRLGDDDDGFDARLALFDRAWASLDADERARVNHVHLDRATPPTRVALALNDSP